MRQVLWIVPELKGGIADYSAKLFPEVEKLLAARGAGARKIAGSASSADEFDRAIFTQIADTPDVIHIQHEYGLFGSKLPTRYSFPEIVQALRQRFPKAKLVATAHTVIGPEFRYPMTGNPIHDLLRGIANILAVPLLKKYWNSGTWSLVDQVIVHSELQRETIASSGGRRVDVIPHFIPQARSLFDPSRRTQIAVFGFFTPEKGQDFAIRAFELVHGKKPELQLVLAGGVRREADRFYLEHCQKLIAELGIQDSVRITGFLDSSDMEDLFAASALVLAPFRATSGSGSIAQALARGMPIVASDLPLNRELNERVPGTVELFKAENANDCAEKILSIVQSDERRRSLASAAASYAETHSQRKIAALHVHLYESDSRELNHAAVAAMP